MADNPENNIFSFRTEKITLDSDRFRKSDGEPDELECNISDSVVLTLKEIESTNVTLASDKVSFLFRTEDLVLTLEDLLDDEVDIEDVFVLNSPNEEEDVVNLGERILDDLLESDEIDTSNQIRPRGLDEDGDPSEEGMNFTMVEVRREDAEKFVEDIGRKYKVLKFDIKLALKTLKNGKHLKKLLYQDEAYKEEERLVLKKKWWKKNCLNKYLTKKVSKVDPTATKGKKVLLLFQGTFKKKAGFYEMLNHQATLEKLAETYGENIFLFNYPTVFRDIKENVQAVIKLFLACDFNNSQVDLVSTSRGTLVARELLVEFHQNQRVFPKGAKTVKKLVSVNSPNIGTPLANDALDLLKKLGDIGFPGAKQWFQIAKLVGINIEPRGISVQGSKDNPYLVKLNAKYNELDTEHHYFLGTENNKKPAWSKVIFDNRINDGVIPVTSMTGDLDPQVDSFGYEGEELNVQNKFIVFKKDGGLNHGKQYMTILLLDKLIEILGESPSSPSEPPLNS